MTRITDRLLYITAPALIVTACRAGLWLIKAVVAFFAMIMAGAALGLASLTGH